MYDGIIRESYSNSRYSYSTRVSRIETNHSPTVMFRIPLGLTTPTKIQFYGRFRISRGKHFHFSIKIHFQIQRGPHFFHHMVDCFVWRSNIFRSVLCPGLCCGLCQTTRKFMFLTKHRASSSRANKRNVFRSRCSFQFLVLGKPLLFQSFHGPQHRQCNGSCFRYDSGCNSGYNSASSGSFGFSGVSVRGLSRSSVVVVVVVVVRQFMLVLLVCLC